MENNNIHDDADDFNSERNRYVSRHTKAKHFMPDGFSQFNMPSILLLLNPKSKRNYNRKLNIDIFKQFYKHILLQFQQNTRSVSYLALRWNYKRSLCRNGG